MADERKIVIEIIQGGGGGGTDQPGDDEDDKKKKLHKDRLRFAKWTGVHVLNAVNQATNFTVDRYLNLTEDYISQNWMNNIKSTYSMAKSLRSSAISGAKIGGVAFGAGGAVAGAVVGLGSAAFSTYISMQRTASSYYQSINAANYQQEFMQTKMGLMGSSNSEN